MIASTAAGKSARCSQSANKSTSSLGRARIPWIPMAWPPASANPAGDRGVDPRGPLRGRRRRVEPALARPPRSGPTRRRRTRDWPGAYTGMWPPAGARRCNANRQPVGTPRDAPRRRVPRPGGRFDPRPRCPPDTRSHTETADPAPDRAPGSCVLRPETAPRRTGRTHRCPCPSLACRPSLACTGRARPAQTGPRLPSPWQPGWRKMAF